MRGKHRAGRKSTHWLSPLRLTLCAFALFFVIFGSWSFSEPLAAGPDEPAQLIHAYALDHGEVGTPLVPASQVNVTYSVPLSLSFAMTYYKCWHFKPDQPASCSTQWPTSTSPEIVENYVSHYPPEYYAFVGIASYLSAGTHGIYFMRVLSDLLSAMALASAVCVLARFGRRRSMIFGLLFSFTPMAYFLASVINPSGFEISMAVAVWCSLLVIALDHQEKVPRGLIAIATVQAVVFELIRGLSTLWLAVALITAVLMVKPRILISLLNRLEVRASALIIGVGAVCAAIWILREGTLFVLPVGIQVPPHETFIGDLRQALHHVPLWAKESVGLLGWLDTSLPHFVYLTWGLLIGVALVAGLVFGNWRQRTALLFIGATAFWLPLFIIARQANSVGLVWQARDGMPLLVGVTLLGAALCAPATTRGLLPKSLLSVGVVIVSALDIVAFYTNLKRYAVGENGDPLFFLHHSAWSPPVGSETSLVVCAVAFTLLATLFVAWIYSDSVNLIPSKPMNA
jgi:Predicted membrane protein (DUF2142)